MIRTFFAALLLFSCTPRQGETSPAPQPSHTLSPVRVVEVKLNRLPKVSRLKWMVIAEDGTLYYTDSKPNIGDTAFYLKD